MKIKKKFINFRHNYFKNNRQTKLDVVKQLTIQNLISSQMISSKSHYVLV